MNGLRPFWRFFGAKWKAAPLYPPPRYSAIVEPFAGAAGYSLRYPDRRVILVELDPTIAAVWRYLIAVSPEELRRVPEVEHVAELPAWVPAPARALVGLRLCAGDTRPRERLSSMRRRDGNWGVAVIADQVTAIRHWEIIEGDYTSAPDIEATWFVDAPYQIKGSRASRAERSRVRYPCGGDAIDYPGLGSWCRTRRGQVIACENAGADWLPFQPAFSLGTVRPGGRHQEVIWTNDEPPRPRMRRLPPWPGPEER